MQALPQRFRPGEAWITSVAFLGYLKEIPFVVQEVLPRVARQGLHRRNDVRKGLSGGARRGG
jgi:hypothetical protein